MDFGAGKSRRNISRILQVKHRFLSLFLFLFLFAFSSYKKQVESCAASSLHSVQENNKQRELLLCTPVFQSFQSVLILEANQETDWMSTWWRYFYQRKELLSHSHFFSRCVWSQSNISYSAWADPRRRSDKFIPRKDSRVIRFLLLFLFLSLCQEEDICNDFLLRKDFPGSLVIKKGKSCTITTIIASFFFFLRTNAIIIRRHIHIPSWRREVCVSISCCFPFFSHVDWQKKR